MAMAFQISRTSQFLRNTDVKMFARNQVEIFNSITHFEGEGARERESERVRKRD